MELNLQNRRALVTGGTRGIGLAIARQFAEEGCHLHLVARDASLLRFVREELTSRHSVEVSTTTIDMAHPEAALEIADACGDVDILVNNAGAIPAGTLAQVSDDDWRASWDLKVFGYVNLARTLFPGMCERRKGVILNIVGTAGERPRAGYLAGSMANASLVAMTRALGLEGMGHGVRVVAIHPGATLTDRKITQLQLAALRRWGSGARWTELMGSYPYGRLAIPQDIAAAAAFLCSDLASYINATGLTIDGGAEDDVVNVRR